jgi:hypothetical protein
VTALAYEIPKPRVLRVISIRCDTCRGQGYHENGALCDDCDGAGSSAAEIVACPVHGVGVIRALTGDLLGMCDGCAAETARALTFLSHTKTTGPADFPLEKLVDGARQETP